MNVSTHSLVNQWGFQIGRLRKLLNTSLTVLVIFSKDFMDESLTCAKYSIPAGPCRTFLKFKLVLLASSLLFLGVKPYVGGNRDLLSRWERKWRQIRDLQMYFPRILAEIALKPIIAIRAIRMLKKLWAKNTGGFGGISEMPLSQYIYIFWTDMDHPIRMTHWTGSFQDFYRRKPNKTRFQGMEMLYEPTKYYFFSNLL
ncbi:hypothetical protein COCSUDRAFT_45678 [Coccomyxa subellipsoidea C-169]|uniref:Uncharacterized protein n=1 Tax=Coccomyxa subellipsoidea (strain C-169) TaxID=574566 RepID=I0YI30_COCSC|nr:hypothetical protein COCSUDRAFT_45678 [Coccomyxa subellipsoidea C-169]EIE18049.1 hypothetical protein COCSUDRAFT_45678 [Coccomyxa subellipsoidea C-169]|eukprot:XP_005642593.1 hypothetical protein COCSUDRAFT_45678 [Coccomyxa subellipsoidea C-169]